MRGVVSVEAAKLSDFYAVDLHIHTPKSEDYKGDKSDSEYIRILREAHQKGLRIIAIGDHNTFKGYHKFLELKRGKEAEIRTLERYAPDNPSLPSLKNELKLYTDVLILPSVELEARPGIHLVLLFDSTTSDEDLQNFLRVAGVTQEDEGKATLSKLINWDCEEAMETASKMGAIAIAPHADSTKGIYNELSRAYRATIFKSTSLYAICFGSSLTKDKMRNLFRQKEYARNTAVSFIQVSDFHGGTDKVGSQLAYVHLPSVSFSSLKSALRNPDESVSCPERPEVMQILNSLASDPSNEFIPNLDGAEEKEQCGTAICAFSNSQDGTVVVGVSKQGNLLGLPKGYLTTRKLSRFIQDSVSPLPSFNAVKYPFGDKEIITLRINRGTAGLYSFRSDGHFYIRSNNETRRASPQQVVDLVEEQLLQRSIGLASTSRERLDEITSRLESHVDGLENLRLARKIHSNTTTLRRVLAMKLSSYLGKVSEEFSDEISIEMNGLPDGNIVVADYCKPREEERYFRFLAVRAQVDPEVIEKSKVSRFSGERLILCSGGGVFYDDKNDMAIYSDYPSPAVVLTLRDEHIGRYRMKFILGWLKSSIPLWYADTHFGTVNLHKREVALDLPIPLDVDESFQSQICSMVEEVLTIESRFLSEEVDMIALKNQCLSEGFGRDSEEIKRLYSQIAGHIDEHNTTIADILSRLEKEFAKLYGLSTEDIAIINKSLRYNKLVTFI